MKLCTECKWMWEPFLPEYHCAHPSKRSLVHGRVVTRPCEIERKYVCRSVPNECSKQGYNWEPKMAGEAVNFNQWPS